MNASTNTPACVNPEDDVIDRIDELVTESLTKPWDQISGYEGGAKSAQPAWDAYMKSVLEGVPEQPLTPPPGIVTVNIDRSTGQLASGGNSRAEYFIEGTQPTQQAVHEVGTTIIDNGETHELF